jgi:uncharacterized protein (TIGR02246 family)
MMLGVLAVANGCAHATAPQRGVGTAPSLAEATAAARALLARGAAAWNAGDLDGFMSDYTPGATFVTSRGLVRGVAAIRERYAARFAPGARRDSLRFEQLTVHPLAPDLVHVVAWYVLETGGRETARGPTSLVLVRQGGRWRIAHDHSS